MKLKWVYGFLVLVFTVTGIYQNDAYLPNQQIVIQFDADALNIEETVEQIAGQLQRVGASHIQINNTDTAIVTIIYYSASDVTSIEKILTNKGLVTYTDPDNSNPKNQKTLTWDVSEIHASKSNTSWDFEGTMVAEYKPISDRFVHQDHSFGKLFQLEDIESLSQEKYVLSDYSACLLIHGYDHCTPMVRAGPKV